MRLKNIRLKKLEIIPVIDLLDGDVVHAIAGNRKEYREFTQSRFQFADPIELTKQLQKEFSPAPIYLADLNAIQGRDQQLDLISDLLAIGGSFLIDFGLKTPDDFVAIRARLGQHKNWSPILASETITDLFSFLRMPHFDPKLCFFSIDIRSGQVMGVGNGISLGHASDWIGELARLGFRRLILMDLDAVGTGSHVHLERIEDQLPLDELNLYAAGGVRSAEDLTQLDACGYSGVLVATAIHSGSINGDSLAAPE